MIRRIWGAAACIAVSALLACDTGTDNAVTGDFTEISPSGLVTGAVAPDSLTITDTYARKLATLNVAFAGNYGEQKSFAVHAFNVRYADLDSLVGVVLRFSLVKKWTPENGAVEFEVYDTTPDFPDTNRIDPADFPITPDKRVASVSDTTDLNFSIDPAIIKAWPGEGAFLLQGGPGNETMISVQSDDASSPPRLLLISNTAGEVDTTTVVSIRGAYHVDTALGDTQGIVSEINGTGYILSMPIPASVPRFAVFNKATLTFTPEQATVPDSPFVVTIVPLIAAFDQNNILVDTVRTLIVEVLPDTPVTVDLTTILNGWHIAKAKNLGLLIRPSELSITPNQAVFAPRDSLRFTYTPLPEASR